MSDMEQVRRNAKAKLYDDLAVAVFLALMFATALATKLLGVR